jgi:hypothetical protein
MTLALIVDGVKPSNGQSGGPDEKTCAGAPTYNTPRLMTSVGA